MANNIILSNAAKGRIAAVQLAYLDAYRVTMHARRKENPNPVEIVETETKAKTSGAVYTELSNVVKEELKAALGLRPEEKLPLSPDTPSGKRYKKIMASVDQAAQQQVHEETGHLDEKYQDEFFNRNNTAPSGGHRPLYFKREPT